MVWLSGYKCLLDNPKPEFGSSEPTLKNRHWPKHLPVNFKAVRSRDARTCEGSLAGQPGWKGLVPGSGKDPASREYGGVWWSRTPSILLCLVQKLLCAQAQWCAHIDHTFAPVYTRRQEMGWIRSLIHPHELRVYLHIYIALLGAEASCLVRWRVPSTDIQMTAGETLMHRQAACQWKMASAFQKRVTLKINKVKKIK